MLFVGPFRFHLGMKWAEKYVNPRLSRKFLAVVQGLKVTSVHGMGEIIWGVYQMGRGNVVGPGKRRELQEGVKEGLASRWERNLVGILPVKWRLSAEDEHSIANCMTVLWEIQSFKEVWLKAESRWLLVALVRRRGNVLDLARKNKGEAGRAGKDRRVKRSRDDDKD